MQTSLKKKKKPSSCRRQDINNGSNQTERQTEREQRSSSTNDAGKQREIFSERVLTCVWFHLLSRDDLAWSVSLKPSVPALSDSNISNCFITASDVAENSRWEPPWQETRGFFIYLTWLVWRRTLHLSCWTFLKIFLTTSKHHYTEL